MKRTALLIISSLLAITLNSQVIDLEDQLILYLPMNGNAQDESGLNVPTRLEGPELTADRHGVPNSAFLFNGIDDNINLNNDEALITSKSFTIAMWARIDGRSQALLGSNSLFEQRDHNKGAPVVIHFNADQDGNSRFTLRSSNDIGSLAVESKYPGDGTWHHFVARMDGNKIVDLFIDGELRGSGTFPNDGDFITSINRVNLGAHHPESLVTGAFNGAIDDVYIYNRAIALCEIEALYSGLLLNER